MSLVKFGLESGPRSNSIKIIMVIENLLHFRHCKCVYIFPHLILRVTFWHSDYNPYFTNEENWRIERLNNLLAQDYKERK